MHAYDNVNIFIYWLKQLSNSFYILDIFFLSRPSKWGLIFSFRILVRFRLNHNTNDMHLRTTPLDLSRASFFYHFLLKILNRVIVENRESIFSLTCLRTTPLNYLSLIFPINWADEAYFHELSRLESSTQHDLHIIVDLLINFLLHINFSTSGLCRAWSFDPH